jgi:hypothetical protein
MDEESTSVEVETGTEVIDELPAAVKSVEEIKMLDVLEGLKGIAPAITDSKTPIIGVEGLVTVCSCATDACERGLRGIGVDWACTTGIRMNAMYNKTIKLS